MRVYGTAASGRAADGAGDEPVRPRQEGARGRERDGDNASRALGLCHGTVRALRRVHPGRDGQVPVLQE